MYTALVTHQLTAPVHHKNFFYIYKCLIFTVASNFMYNFIENESKHDTTVAQFQQLFVIYIGRQRWFTQANKFCTAPASTAYTTTKKAYNCSFSC